MFVDLIGEKEFESAWNGVMAAAADGCRNAVTQGIAEAVALGRNTHTFKNITGDLEKSIGGEVTNETMRGAEGVIYAKAPYASFVEEDTVPHVIRPKAAWNQQGPLQESQGRRKRGTGGAHATLAWESPQGDWHFAREVHHPGTKGQPFMGPMNQKCAHVAIRAIEESAVEAQRALDS